MTNTSLSLAPQPYENLEAWKACHQFTLALYSRSQAWPPIERFGLTSQLRRAAWSAAANIVEGAARRGTRDFARFLNISVGSLAEAGYGLRLARDLGYLTGQQWEILEGARQSAARLTWRLYDGVRRKAQAQSKSEAPKNRKSRT